MFDNTFAKLPAQFFERIHPTPVRSPQLLKLNAELAHDLSFDVSSYSSAELSQFFAGNRMLPAAEPLAQAYAGHQFGNFVPQLGDGRAILLGEVVDRFGQRRDIQLKGAGRTRFSRGGDGRAGLGAVIREYVLGEAMFHLGIPTTRGLAIVSTGEDIRREVPQPGAIFTRVAASHVRIGTFEYFAARGDVESIKTLADYVIARHYPELANVARPYQELLAQVVLRQARLIARWCEVGFVHGVMNTDNMTISGETIDYGPCAFIDEYEPSKVFSSIDHRGRYAFANQPRIAVWNLSVLAHCLQPLLVEGEEALALFEPCFYEQHLAAISKKLGLTTRQPGDEMLVQGFFALMHHAEADYTLSFRTLSHLDFDKLKVLLGDTAEFATWLSTWNARCAEEARANDDLSRGMLAVNPAYIARNHLVERAIADVVERDDWTSTDLLLEAVCMPFEERAHLQALMVPPTPAERVTQTFCGT